MYTLLSTFSSSCWFILAFMFFHRAIQLPADYTRLGTGALSMVSIAMCLKGARLGLVPYTQVWVPFVMGIAMHTAAILFIQPLIIIFPRLTSVTERVMNTSRIWTNIRNLHLPAYDRAALETSATMVITQRHPLLDFAASRFIRIVMLCYARVLANLLSFYILGSLRLTIEHFAPNKQSLLPSPPWTQQDTTLRAIISLKWIWATYSALTVSHDLCAILFVCIIRRDRLDEWPALYGPVSEIYTLRRFWGIFWQRLHVSLFELYTPPFLFNLTYRNGSVRKAIRAFWIFFLSAVCHATVNWLTMARWNLVQELRFFLSNYALCLLETIAGRRMRHRARQLGNTYSWRLLGCIWVLGIFFFIVPAWQYSLIYTAVVNRPLI
jgi:hypothetical protein